VPVGVRVHGWHAGNGVVRGTPGASVGTGGRGRGHGVEVRMQVSCANSPDCQSWDPSSARPPQRAPGTSVIAWRTWGGALIARQRMKRRHESGADEQETNARLGTQRDPNSTLLPRMISDIHDTSTLNLPGAQISDFATARAVPTSIPAVATKWDTRLP